MIVEQNGTIVGDQEDPANTEGDYESPKVLSNPVMDIKLFKRRWFQLFLFTACCTVSNIQWFQYAICSNIMQKYWGVSSAAIEWTTVIYMVVYLVFAFPATQVMGRVGLRWTLVLGAGGTCLGAWIKVLSISPDLFVVTFIGHTIVAISHIFLINFPGRLAAYWFGSNELATATTIACFSIPAGNVINFIVTTHSVRNHADIADIGDDLYKYFINMAIMCTVVFVLILLLFQNEPLLPPSITRALQRVNRETGNVEGVLPAVKRILTYKSFMIFCNTYGLLVNILPVMSTVMNALYLAHFENGELEVGNLGLVLAVCGTIGSTLFAVILDRTKKFRLIFTALSYLTLLSQVMFAMSMIMEVKWLVFVSCGIWGFILVGFTTTGLELCIETTYPETEEVVLGVFSTATQVYGSIMILITGRMLAMYGDVAGHACMIAFAAFGAILGSFGKLDLRRLKAAKAAGYIDVKSQQLNSPIVH